MVRVGFVFVFDPVVVVKLHCEQLYPEHPAGDSQIYPLLP